MELQAGVEGQREHCKQVALDVRELAKKMGARYELELERAVSVAESLQCPEGLRAPGGDRGDPEELAPQGPSSGSEARAADFDAPTGHSSDAQELATEGPSVRLEARAEDASGGGASEPATQPRLKGLQVQAGAALSIFDAQCLRQAQSLQRKLGNFGIKWDSFSQQERDMVTALQEPMISGSK